MESVHWERKSTVGWGIGECVSYIAKLCLEEFKENNVLSCVYSGP